MALYVLFFVMATARAFTCEYKELERPFVGKSRRALVVREIYCQYVPAETAVTYCFPAMFTYTASTIFE